MLLILSIYNIGSNLLIDFILSHFEGFGPSLLCHFFFGRHSFFEVTHTHFRKSICGLGHRLEIATRQPIDGASHVISRFEHVDFFSSFCLRGFSYICQGGFGYIYFLSIFCGWRFGSLRLRFFFLRFWRLGHFLNFVIIVINFEHF